MLKMRNKAKKITMQALFFLFYSTLTASLLVSAVIIGASSALIFRNYEFQNRVFPDVYADGIQLTGKTEAAVKSIWHTKNNDYRSVLFELQLGNQIATLSASDLQLGYDDTLIARQAMLIGRSGNFLSDAYIRLLRPKTVITPILTFQTDIFKGTVDTLAQSVDTPPQEALFTFNNGRVTEFRPSATGKRVNREVAYNQFVQLIRNLPKNKSGRYPIILSVEPVQPRVATQNTNSFGIKEKIGTGYSEFAGSIPGRIHNVALAASKFNGVVIPPGGTLSYNEIVGDISAATGFQQGYIIKDGRTVLGDGGGVCQVSTTIFRAALNAGLPILERQGHAYRVHYYEEGGFKPGLDATVFAPSVDLKVKNDTPGYILLLTKADLNKLSLVVDIYGTSDGRVATVTTPEILSQSPPPPPLYQDDPTLPNGTIKQIDWEAWGAKTVFQYSVKRGNDTLINQQFVTNFRPWQAVYLRGTQQ